MPVLTTSAILLRSYPFSETSQTVRFYTETHGIMGAMARGFRKTGGRRGGALMTFSEGILELHFKENRDLQTLREFSPTRVRRGLAQDPLRLVGASVLGELILRHAESEGNPQVFERLRLGLDDAEMQDRASFLPVLLGHLWVLIRCLGFGPLVGECAECGRVFSDQEIARFDFGAGGVVCQECQGEGVGPRMGPVARAQLDQLLTGVAPDGLIKTQAHLRLVSDFITYHLSGGTPLRSVAVLAALSDPAPKSTDHA